MKKYGIKLPDGKWYNNSYNTRYTKGTSADEPRLLTLAGCRMSLGIPLSDNIKAALPDQGLVKDFELAEKERHKSTADNYKYWEMRRIFWKEMHKFIKSLDSNAYWVLLAKDGYELVEFDITPVVEADSAKTCPVFPY